MGPEGHPWLSFPKGSDLWATYVRIKIKVEKTELFHLHVLSPEIKHIISDLSRKICYMKNLPPFGLAADLQINLV
jgi:hypothetical protein